jgi:hypothetical protein
MALLQWRHLSADAVLESVKAGAISKVWKWWSGISL